MRVAVPFGKRKVYAALAHNKHQTPPQTYEAREIEQILDESPVVTQKQLKHWEWIASYYMCSLGEVFRSAMPTAFLLESETIIYKNEKQTVDEASLDDEEFQVYEALQHQPSLSIQRVMDILGKKTVLPVIYRLVQKEVLQLKEEVYEQYKPKMVRYVRLHPNYGKDEALQQLLDTLGRAPKQRKTILTLFSLQASEKKPIPVKQLMLKSESSPAVVRALIDKEILETYHLQQDRVSYDGTTYSSKELSEAQNTALQGIQESFVNSDVTLLHGVTSSGKTEIYVKLIEEMIAKGKQVLYLLPEIALTTQLIQRLQRYFGEKVSIYHSRYSVNERVEVWNHVLRQHPKASVVIGARSAISLPFSNLGLVITDEEHESSFKQFDPAPRYHGRDVAIVLAKLHQAKVLLGSATPSLESYFNAQAGKYGLVELTKRFGNVLMPDIELVDLKEKHRKKRMKGHFSDRLLEEMEETLKVRKQIILFQNRRGYAPIVECTTCGHSPQCPNCDVSLTYHQYRDQLRCHYCGYNIAMQRSCLACGDQTLDTKGFGTQQIEEEVKSLFPDHRVGRMDLDTTRGKHGYQKIINAFELQELDVLVGTQMLTKGLDFKNVQLVGVLNADSLINYPDFRSHERTFQLLQQVSGRAGRFDERGKVIIQTYNPYHRIFQQVSVNDYTGMYDDQVEERYQYKYPPYHRLIRITLKHRDHNMVNEASEWFAKGLRNVFQANVLGPEFPPISRIRNQYIKHILLKIPKGQHLGETKAVVHRLHDRFNAVSSYRKIRLILDVDCY